MGGQRRGEATGWSMPFPRPGRSQVRLMTTHDRFTRDRVLNCRFLRRCRRPSGRLEARRSRKHALTTGSTHMNTPSPCIRRTTPARSACLDVGSVRTPASDRDRPPGRDGRQYRLPFGQAQRPSRRPRGCLRWPRLRRADTLARNPMTPIRNQCQRGRCHPGRCRRAGSEGRSRLVRQTCLAGPSRLGGLGCPAGPRCLAGLGHRAGRTKTAVPG